MNLQDTKTRTIRAVKFTEEFKKIDNAIFNASMEGNSSIVWKGIFNFKISRYLTELGFLVEPDLDEDQVIENQEVIISWE